MEFFAYLLNVAFLAVLVWLFYRNDRRLADVLDRNMALTDTIGQFKAMDRTPPSNDLFWQDLETGELKPLQRGDGSSVEEVEGASA